MEENTITRYETQASEQMHMWLCKVKNACIMGAGAFSFSFSFFSNPMLWSVLVFLCMLMIQNHKEKHCNNIISYNVKKKITSQ